MAKQQKTMRPWLSYLFLCVGVVISSLSFSFFFLPNDIAPGGFTGFAMVLNALLGIPVGATMLALNLPLFFGSYKKMGRAFAAKSFCAMVAMSLLIDTIPRFTLTDDSGLASVYGGVLLGLGVGLVIRSGATTGGTDMLATLVHRLFRTSIPLAWILFAVDLVVVVLAGIVFEPQAALYAIATLFISSRIIDVIQEGVSSAKAFFIITAASEAIAQRILHELDRGATALHGRGMYTGEARDVLFCVVSRSEVSLLKRIVAQEDSHAFVVVSDAREAMGEGFMAQKTDTR